MRKITNKWACIIALGFATATSTVSAQLQLTGTPATAPINQSKVGGKIKVDQLLIDPPADRNNLKKLESAHTLEEVAKRLTSMGIAFARRYGVLDRAMMPGNFLAHIDGLPPGEPFITQQNDKLVINAIVPGTLSEPTDQEGFIQRGMMNAESGYLDAAIADYDRALELGEPFARIYALRGLVYARMHDPRAEKDLAIAEEFQPDSSVLHWGRYVVAMQSADYVTALAYTNKLIRGGENSAQVFENRANLHRLLGRYDEALADTKTGLEKSPGLTSLQFITAYILADQNKWTEANAQVDAILTAGRNLDTLI